MKKIKYIVFFVLLIAILTIIGLFIIKNNKTEEKKILKEEVSEKKTNSKTRKTLDNSNYVGIYTYSDDLETTLTLTKGYDAVFYIGDDNNKSYYLGKYQVTEDKIVMYKIKIIDTTNLEETNLNDDIYFNIVNPNTITSIYGRNESIRLQKIDNSV